MISFVCIDIPCDPFADLYKSAVSWMVPAELYWYKWYVFRSEPIGSKMEDFFICRRNDFFVENKTESTVSISDEITQIIYFNVCQNYLGFYDYDIVHIESTWLLYLKLIQKCSIRRCLISSVPLIRICKWNAQIVIKRWIFC